MMFQSHLPEDKFLLKDGVTVLKAVRYGACSPPTLQ